MKIHHLNCGTLHPLMFKNALNSDLISQLKNFIPSDIFTLLISQVNAKDFLSIQKDVLNDVMHLVCHCLLIEDGEKLILVDTGFGRFFSIYDYNSFLTPFHKYFLGPKLSLQETAYEQIKVKGYDPRDVTDIILTHLDADHVGGLFDFPWATAHLLEAEWFAANNPATLNEKNRYDARLWKTHENIVLYDDTKIVIENGLKFILLKNGISNNISLVPLAGHTRGHAGVYIKGLERDLFFVADSYLHHGQLDANFKALPVEIYNQSMQYSLPMQKETLQVIKDLKSNSEVTIFSTHDRAEFLSLS
jgi:glyoxylase-like metal-dependent hydrolase (beta-lactamase superfamily II)